MVVRIITKITDLIFLTYELLIGNRKLIFPTMVGLIIALTVISQSGVLVESYRQEIFDETIFSDQPDYYEERGDISVEIYNWGLKNLTTVESDFFTDFERFGNYVNTSMHQVDYSDYISNYFWYNYYILGIWLNETDPYSSGQKEYDHTMNFFSSSAPKFYSQIEALMKTEEDGRLPKNSSEIVLVRPKGMPEEWEIEWEKRFENLTLNTKVNITIPRWGIPEGEDQINKTVTIVGILRVERQARIFYDYSSAVSSIDDNATLLVRKYLGDLWNNYYFITQPEFLKQITDEILAPYPNLEMEKKICGKIFLDQTRFNAYNVKGEISKLQNFIEALQIQLYEITYSPNIYSRILSKLREYQSTIFGLILILLLVSFPVLCIALYLVVYSFGLIRKQKQEQIGIIKTRGGSWYQILVILIGEMVVSTIIAVIIGFFTSIFLADLVMRSTDYLEFFGVQVPVLFSVEMLQGLLFLGIILALILNFGRIIQMSKQQITETLVPTETKDPIWKRYYFDVIIFIVGTCTWIIFMTLINSFGGEEVEPIAYTIFPIISLLALPAPFFMFFGSIMVIARIFPFLMKKLSDLFWKIEGGISSFSIRNIVRHKQAANRAVLLITLALSFSILSSSLIFSLDETQHLKYYYSEGADLTLSENGYLNKTFLPILKENITQLSSISVAYSANYESWGYIEKIYRFLFVDPKTYAKTAFNDPSFKLSSPLPSLMNQLANNETILLFQGNLKEDISKPRIGDNLTIYLTNGTSYTKDYSFRIGGTFKYWPMMYPVRWYEYTRYYWIIGSLGMFKQLNQSGFLRGIYGKYLAKVDSLNNIEEAVDTVYNMTGVSPSSPALQYKEYKTSFGRKFRLSILNSDLIICSAVAIIGVIMFAFFTYVERGKEIGVERALGMTQVQTVISFLVEATMILAFGVVIGTLTGMYFVTMFLQITQFGESIPPVVVTYPIALLTQMLIGMIVLAGIGTVVPAYLATRKDISRILKVE
ncbi:MAG: FtsX-like permease family protein [Candidatus Hodarchaeota archaeon]